MTKFTRLEVANIIQQTGLVPVFYNSDFEVCKKILKACYDGGIRAFEFTNRGDFAHEVFGELNKYALLDLPGLVLGAGSLLEAGTTSLYIQLGAGFVVSPVLNEDMAKVCNRRKILWAPGCGSVSEISKAEELGAELVKIFPANQVGGPEFVKAIKGPMPWCNIMPTGGVDTSEENIKAWFEAGVFCVGMGTQLIRKNFISENKFDELTLLVEQTLTNIKKYK